MTSELRSMAQQCQKGYSADNLLSEQSGAVIRVAERILWHVECNAKHFTPY